MLANLDPFSHADLPNKSVAMQDSTLDHLFEFSQSNDACLLAIAAILPGTRSHKQSTRRGQTR